MKKLLFGCLCLGVMTAYAQKNTSKPTLVATQAFLKTLSPEQMQKALFPYDTSERRKWFFVPIERKGLPLLEMTEAQKNAALNLVRASVSEHTGETAIAIMQLEIVLKQIEKLPPENHRRHPGKFYFSIFGTPDAQKRWGWRIEGHHISLNFSSESGKVISGSPLFLGSNPAIVPEGYPEAGKQLIKQEEVLGLALLNSLSAEQRSKAIVAEKSPWEIFSTNSEHYMGIDTLKNGIRFTELTKEQQQKLMQLISLYVQRYPFGFADEFMAKIEKAGLDKLIFTWMGPAEAKIGNGGHYYRIQNPVLFVEYDNTQNNANHVHTVIRDLTNDFGEDMLRKHYEQEHKK
ncbi:MAG: DUF3500 domain-containing protein [Spirosomataceae bacterium]